MASYELSDKQVEIIIQLLTDKHDWFIAGGLMKASRVMADIAHTINQQKK